MHALAHVFACVYIPTTPFTSIPTTTLPTARRWASFKPNSPGAYRATALTGPAANLRDEEVSNFVKKDDEVGKLTLEQQRDAEAYVQLMEDQFLDLCQVWCWIQQCAPLPQQQPSFTSWLPSSSLHRTNTSCLLTNCTMKFGLTSSAMMRAVCSLRNSWVSCAQFHMAFAPFHGSTTAGDILRYATEVAVLCRDVHKLGHGEWHCFTR